MQSAIQTALYTQLNSAGLGATVVEYMPQVADGGSDSGFPYVAMGRVIFTENDTQTVNGGAFIARIHTHTRDGSLVGCKAIQDAIFAALHKQELTVSGANNFSLLRNDTDTQHMGDKKIHGICEYRGLIEEV